MPLLDFTQAQFEQEKTICNGVYLRFTDYLTNATINGLVGKTKVLGDSEHLHALMYFLHKIYVSPVPCRFISGIASFIDPGPFPCTLINGTVIYVTGDEIIEPGELIFFAARYSLGGIEIAQEDLLRLIDLIHHYDVPFIGTEKSEYSESGSYDLNDWWYESSASSSGIIELGVDPSYRLSQVFLNGILISVTHWQLIDGMFSYIGPISLNTDDWFNFHFAKIGSVSSNFPLVNSSFKYDYLNIPDVWIEVMGNPTNNHTVLVDSSFNVVEAFLNGILISNTDWSYSSNTFRYKGSIAITANDWFNLHMIKESVVNVSGCTFVNGTATYVDPNAVIPSASPDCGCDCRGDGGEAIIINSQ